MDNVETIIEENKFLSTQNTKLKNELSELHYKLSRLEKQLGIKNKQLFGKKSEKSDSNQIPLDLSLDQTATTPVIEESEVIDVKGHKRLVKREKLNTDLPVVETIYYQPKETTCECCQKELLVIGEEVTTTVKYIPATIGLVEHIKVKKACSSCKQSGVKTGEIPNGVIPIEKSKASESLLSHIIVSKFKDHIPLNRQEDIFRRHNVIIPKQTMCDWLLKTADILEPIYKEIHRVLLKESYLLGDETTIKIQELDKIGYFWGLLSPPSGKNLVWFHYSSSRSSEVPKAILPDFNGALSCDHYAGYNQVIKDNRITRIGCFAHVRRKFIESTKFAKSECGYIIKLIANLYKIEEESDLDKRLKKRATESVKILDKLFDYLREIKSSLLPRHQLHDAIDYALNQEDSLRVYTTNKFYLIDNNPIEREVRPIAVGRKNYMFCQNENGARAASIFYTIINCCRLNKINPYEYIKDIVLKVQVTKNSQIQALLPSNWDSQELNTSN